MLPFIFIHVVFARSFNAFCTASCPAKLASSFSDIQIGTINISANPGPITIPSPSATLSGVSPGNAPASRPIMSRKGPATR